MNRNIKTFIACLLPACLLLACNSSRLLPIPPYPALPESYINVPLKIYAVPFLKKAESLAAPELTSEGWPGFMQAACDFRYKYRFIRSGIRVGCTNNEATITLAGNYQIAGSKSICAFGKQVAPWITGSCGFSPEAMRRIEISVHAAFRFLPGYAIQCTSSVDKINAIDKCTVTLLNTDVTRDVTETIRSSVQTFSASLDRSVGALKFPELLQMAGTQLGSKVSLQDYGYMQVNPASVTISPLNYIKDTLRLTVGVTCYPDLTSDSSITRAARKLPPLNSGALHDGFMVNMNAVYDYPFINSYLSSMVKHMPLHIMGNTVLIRDVMVRGLEQNKIELKIFFTGSKSGAITLTGTPMLDIQHQIISIPDLDYTLQSRNLLLTLGKTLLNKKIIRFIREKAVLKTEDVYRQNKIKIDSVLNRSIASNAFTTGNTQQVKLTALKVEKDNLLFQLSVTGMLNLVITGYSCV